MAKDRVGLHKNCSAIFEGVWIPPKNHRRPFAAPKQKQQVQKSKIEHIISQMKCSKGFECYKSEFKNLCKAREIAGTELVECSPENQQACEFRTTFMETAFCKCQLRCYIAKNLPASQRGEHK